MLNWDNEVGLTKPTVLQQNAVGTDDKRVVNGIGDINQLAPF